MAQIVGYTSYETKEGDRWDTVAFAAYGDIQQMPVLIAANREVGIPLQFAAGLKLRIPILAETGLTSPELLPPWKR